MVLLPQEMQKPYGNVRIDATDQGLHDVGNAIGNLSDRALMSVKVTISADLEESI